MTELLTEQADRDGRRVTAPNQELRSSSARFGAFTDAVVAIAMTLLILPLMENVPEAGRESITVAQYLHEHDGQLLTFLISFVLIAMFWVLHHRVFRADTPGLPRRTVVNFAWMLTIVLMPVSTALTGELEADRLLLLGYVGNLGISSWLLFALTVIESSQRRRHDLITPNRTVLAAPLAMSILFTLVLATCMLAPQLAYFPLFAMTLTAPLRALLIRMGLRDAV